jgi:hypothetical protein
VETKIMEVMVIRGARHVSIQTELRGRKEAGGGGHYSKIMYGDQANEVTRIKKEK